MKSKKLKLDVNNAIFKGIGTQFKAGLKPITTRRQLSLKLKEKYKAEKTTANSIYSKLYRYEFDGFYRKDKKLIDNICEILQIKEEDLVIEF